MPPIIVVLLLLVFIATNAYALPIEEFVAHTINCSNEVADTSGRCKELGYVRARKTIRDGVGVGGGLSMACLYTKLIKSVYFSFPRKQERDDYLSLPNSITMASKNFSLGRLGGVDTAETWLNGKTGSWVLPLGHPLRGNRTARAKLLAQARPSSVYLLTFDI